MKRHPGRPLPILLLLLICAGLLIGSLLHPDGRPTSSAGAILALVSALFLELQATPLAVGYFSPAPCWSIALTGLDGVGLPWVLACVGCSIAIRVMISPPSPNGALADMMVDFLPAALAAVAADRLGLLLGMPIYVIAAVPLPGLLSGWLAPSSTAGKTRRSLLLEHLALVSLGPVALLLGNIHPALMVLVWPSLFSLLRASSTGVELSQRRLQHVAIRNARSELTFQEKKLGEAEERQFQLQQLLDARADTFALLEALSARPLGEREALEEALLALRQRLPGSECLYVPFDGQVLRLPANSPPEVEIGLKRAWIDQLPWIYGTRAAWPLPQRGLVLIQGAVPLRTELQHTLRVFFHYLQIMLDRVRFQENILVALNTEANLRKELSVAVTRLQALLGGASELASLVQPREILELLIKRATQWTCGRACQASHGGIQLGEAPAQPLTLPLAGGEFRIECQGMDESEIEALRLWVLLGAGALERCQAQASLVHGSKLAAIGQLAAGVAHELNTPLGSVSLALGMALQNLEKKPERARSRLELALKAVEQMRNIVARLLNYSRESGEGRRTVSLAEVVQDSVQLVDQSFQLEGVELTSQLQEVLVQVNPGEIKQVLLNLLVNARQAVAGCSHPQVRVEIDRCPEGVMVQVLDNGPGVPIEAIDRIFEPFFTTRELGQGVGLGLSLSREMVVAHGGTLRYQPGPRGGACFQITLPVCEE